jgi:hypothetical protein
MRADGKNNGHHDSGFALAIRRCQFKMGIESDKFASSTGAMRLVALHGKSRVPRPGLNEEVQPTAAPTRRGLAAVAASGAVAPPIDALLSPADHLALGTGAAMADVLFMEPLTFLYTAHQQQRWRSGNLRDQWLKCYPQLFDEEDRRLCESQCDYHFFECLAAILIYEATGYLSLVEKYETKKHTRKIQTFRRIVSPEIFSLMEKDSRGAPDLFVYAPDESDWYFCEVKGGPDTLKENQLRMFKRLYDLCGRKPVRVLELRKS